MNYLFMQKNYARILFFVRADFYINDSNIIFGELTFTPAAGLDNKISNVLLPNGDAIMGEYLKLPKLPYHSKG